MVKNNKRRAIMFSSEKQNKIKKAHKDDKVTQRFPFVAIAPKDKR